MGRRAKVAKRRPPSFVRFWVTSSTARFGPINHVSNQRSPTADRQAHTHLGAARRSRVGVKPRHPVPAHRQIGKRDPPTMEAARSSRRLSSDATDMWAPLPQGSNDRTIEIAFAFDDRDTGPLRDPPRLRTPNSQFRGGRRPRDWYQSWDESPIGRSGGERMIT